MRYRYIILVCFAAVITLTLGTTCFADVYETRGRPYDRKSLACTYAINDSHDQAEAQCGSSNNAYFYGCREGYHFNCLSQDGCSCTRMGARFDGDWVCTVRWQCR